MTSVLLAPHHDDEMLFAAFTILRDRPRVIIVLESHLQELRGNKFLGRPITDAMRRQEAHAAMCALYGIYPNSDLSGLLQFWPFRDDDPDWDAIEQWIFELQCDTLFIPAFHEGGHVQHNELSLYAQAARRAHGQSTEIIEYCTYVRGTPDERVTGGTLVAHKSEWVSGKLRALAEYESQIDLWPHHFLAEQKEYYL